MYKKCVFLKQKMNKTLFCKKQNKTINIRECYNCNLSQFPKIEKSNIIKKKSKQKSKLAKATDIAKEVKLVVWERDNHKCIFCHKPVSWHFANSHYIKRSQKGLGIEQNIMTNCEACHKLYEESKYRVQMKIYAKKYFISKYNNWNEKDLVYKKYN